MRRAMRGERRWQERGGERRWKERRAEEEGRRGEEEDVGWVEVSSVALHYRTDVHGVGGRGGSSGWDGGLLSGPPRSNNISELQTNWRTGQVAVLAEPGRRGGGYTKKFKKIWVKLKEYSSKNLHGNLEQENGGLPKTDAFVSRPMNTFYECIIATF